MSPKKLSLVVLFVTACGNHLPVTATGDSTQPVFQTAIDIVEKDLNAHGVPGASLAVVENGRLLAAAGIGEKERGGTDDVTPLTHFRVASLSKMIAAATAMKLVEEGKLDLTKPITDYVPLALATPFDASTITTTHLLTHTSGLPDLGIGASCPVGPGQLAAWWGENGAQPLWTPPGAVWNYSNRGFSALGWIIEAASGQSFEEAAQKRVLDPAGMTTATYDPTIGGDVALGLYDSGETHEPDAYDCAATRPADGILATPSDYAHFAETILAGGGSMLSADSVTAMTATHADTDQLPDENEGYGYGLFVVENYKGHRVIFHSGSDPGFRSFFLMVPDQQFALALFYDAEKHSPKSTAEHLLDLFLGLENIPPPDTATPSSTWSQYAGSYLDPFNFGAITVLLDGAQLRANAPAAGVEDLALTQSAGDLFTATLEGKSASVTFYPGALGPASWLVTRDGVGVRQP